MHEVGISERTLEEVFFEMTEPVTHRSTVTPEPGGCDEHRHDEPADRNPVLRSTRAELLRLRKWPAVWVTLGAWLRDER